MPNPAQDPEVDALSISAIKALKSAQNNAVGTELFSAIEDTSLTAQQKQQVYCNVAEYVTKEACTNLADPATVMRGNNAGSQFMTQYMEKYAADYLAAVEHQALQAVNGLQLPAEGTTTTTITQGEEGPVVSGDADTTLRPGNVPQAGFRSSPEGDYINRRDLSPAATAAWDAVYQQAGQSIVNAMQEQMPKLSSEARAFLKTCGDTARQTLPGQPGESAATFVMSNTLALRGALLQTKADSDSLKLTEGAPDQQKILGEVLGQASNVAQSYINFLPQNGQNGKISEVSKPQNRIVNLLRENGLEQSRQIFGQISQGQVPPTPANQLAPANAEAVVNQAVPGREARMSPPAPAQAPAPAIQPATEPAAQKSRLSSVRDSLAGGASRLKNAVGGALDRKGGEQKLKDVDDATREAYQNLQGELSNLKKDYLKAVDPSKMNGDSPAKIDQLKERMAEVQTELDTMKAANKGLAQMDRSKVGQMFHSGVRDAAKAVGNKLKN